MKIALLDLETSGLDPTKHDILELGMVVFDSETFEILHTFDSKVALFSPERADPKALEVNGYTKEAWKDALSLREVLCRIAPLTRDATFCANNVCFDWAFFKEGCEKTASPITFSYRKVDIFSVAWAKMPHTMASWSLKNICIALGIEPEPEVHTALAGATKAYEVYKKLMG